MQGPESPGKTPTGPKKDMRPRIFLALIVFFIAGALGYVAAQRFMGRDEPVPESARREVSAPEAVPQAPQEDARARLVRETRQWLAMLEAQGMLVEYRDMAVDTYTGAVTLEDVVLRPPCRENAPDVEQMSMDRVVLHDFSGWPYRGHYCLTGIRMPEDAWNQADREFMTELGYDPSAMKLDMTVNYVYEPGSQDLVIRKLDFGIQQALYFSLSLHVSKINLTELGIMALPFTYPGIVIHDARLEMRDDSMIRRIVAKLAEEEGYTREEYLHYFDVGMNIMVSRARQEGGPHSEYVIEALEAFRAFAKDPDVIYVSISPQTPVAVKDLMGLDPLRILETLRVKVRANEKPDWLVYEDSRHGRNRAGRDVNERFS